MKRDRRDHPVVPAADTLTCQTCGDRIDRVLGYGVPDYWRHRRRS